MWFCFQMDSEGEEQTLKTCNSSTGECTLFFFYGITCFWTRINTLQHACSTYRHRLGVSVQQSNFITVNFMSHLHSLKSTAQLFYYSEGNNFIKLEHALKLVKECAYILCDWKPLNGICAIMQAFRGLGGLPARDGAITTSGRIHKTCYHWLCFTGVVVELVNVIYAGGPPLGKLIHPFRSCCQCRPKDEALLLFQENEQTQWEAFSDQ